MEHKTSVEPLSLRKCALSLPRRYFDSGSKCLRQGGYEETLKEVVYKINISKSNFQGWRDGFACKSTAALLEDLCSISNTYIVV